MAQNKRLGSRHQTGLVVLMLDQTVAFGCSVVLFLLTVHGLPCPPQVRQSCAAKEEYFEEQLKDHFTWKTPQTWRQRYLISDSFFNHTHGPIFFYGKAIRGSNGCR